MAGKLKPLDVERETKPGKYADGGGLYLIVASAAAKNWSYRYWIDRKERWHGLGSFRDLSLKEARLARDAARLRVKGYRSTPGVDIVAEKRAARQKTRAAESATAAPTFEQCAERHIDDQWSTWSAKHRAQWPASLKRYAYPTIGHLTIAEIRPSHIARSVSPWKLLHIHHPRRCKKTVKHLSAVLSVTDHLNGSSGLRASSEPHS